MNKYIAHTLTFIFGAAVGTGATYKFLQTKLEKKYQKDVEDVKKAFGERLDELQKSKWNIDISDESFDVAEAKLDVKTEEVEDIEIVNRKDYEKPETIDYTTFYKKETNADMTQFKSAVKDHPYVIHPDEFGDCNYTKISLTLYNDGVLTEFDDEDPITDIEDTIGVESLKRMGEFEPDVVYVRNDKRRCDYEVSLDGRDYEDIMGGYPY